MPRSNQEARENRRAPAQPAGAGLECVRFRALGADCEIQFVSPDPKSERAFIAEATKWVNEFEAKYSRLRPDSLISRINAAAGRDWVALDADAERIFALADQIHVLTRGIIDPSILPLVRLWNYRAPAPTVPTPEQVRAAAAKVGWTRVRREPGRVYLPEAGMGLDLAGFGAEFAVDRVTELARGHGISRVLVDFGHVMRACGAPPEGATWIVGVEDPEHPGVNRARLALSDRGVATSGDYLRFFESHGRHFGHIIDPRSGYPVENECVAVTVVANACLEAGLLATTAYVLGADEGLQLLESYADAEGCIVTRAGERRTREFSRYVS